MAAAIIETRDRTWSPVLEELTATALDCIQTGLAILADRHYGTGAHLVLGAKLGFALSDKPGRPPTVEVPVEQRIAEADELAGLRVLDRRDGLDGPALRRFAESDGPLYVVADTFTMPWTPYRRQRHMEHSFLLNSGGGRNLVIDAYHNETQWGPSRPGIWQLSDMDFDAVIGAGVSAMVIGADGRPQLDPAKVLADNASTLAAAAPGMHAYLDTIRAGADSVAVVEAMVLDVWLLGRARMLHSAWLQTLPGLASSDVDAAQQQAWEWLRLAAQSYVGLRRVQRGAELPPSVLDRMAELLSADIDVAARFAAGPTAIKDLVIGAVRTALRLGETVPVPTDRPLRALPNFNSFRLVDIIEQVESRLGVTLDADDLTVETLRDIDTMAELFARAVTR